MTNDLWMGRGQVDAAVRHRRMHYLTLSVWGVATWALFALWPMSFVRTKPGVDVFEDTPWALLWFAAVVAVVGSCAYLLVFGDMGERATWLPSAREWRSRRRFRLEDRVARERQRRDALALENQLKRELWLARSGTEAQLAEKRRLESENTGTGELSLVEETREARR